MRLLWIALVSAMLISGAYAAEPTREAKAEAKRLFDEGTTFYNLAEYPRAIEKYRAAYALVPEPTLLFNIAQAYRAASDFRMARTFYKNYLNNAPDAPNRRLVEEKIAEMSEALAKQEKASTGPPTFTMEPGKGESSAPTVATEAATAGKAPPAATTTPPAEPSTPPSTAATQPEPAQPATVTTTPPATERTPLYKKWWLWTAVGAVVVVGVAVGVGVGVGASSTPASVPASDYGNTRIFGITFGGTAAAGR